MPANTSVAAARNFRNAPLSAPPQTPLRPPVSLRLHDLPHGKPAHQRAPCALLNSKQQKPPERRRTTGSPPREQPPPKHGAAMPPSAAVSNRPTISRNAAPLRKPRWPQHEDKPK